MELLFLRSATTTPAGLIEIRPGLAISAELLQLEAGQRFVWEHAVLAATGTLVFMLRGSLLAWNRSMTSLPMSAVATLGTYYGAL